MFDAKTDKGSADLYFHYYGMLMHQQNMLQDMTRTGTYHAVVMENRVDFEGKAVMDVGAGSGILSMFAAQAGARKVFAVEASGMATFAQKLADKNSLGNIVQVCHCKVEELQLPADVGLVDVLVSEPMGTLLVNERMLETYLYARDHFLKPGGKMFPQVGRIHAAAFSDPLLHSELLGKASFWQQSSFYGIDMTPLHKPAVDGYFAQVVVDAFDPSVLVSDCATRVFDFATMKETELHDISIPLNLVVAHPCTLHGIACWFDVLFNGTSSQRWLSTAPGLPTTHWFQLRCCLQQPLLLLTPNTRLTGTLRLLAHERQSYDVHLELVAPPISPGMPVQQSSGKFDMKEPYYRQLTTWAQTQQVWISAAEASAIAQHLDLPLRCFLALHTRSYSKKVGWYMLQSNMDSEARECTFLRPDNTCAIHPVRPLQCSTYPWWPELMDAREWAWEKANICEGFDHPEAPQTSLADAAMQLKLATAQEYQKMLATKPSKKQQQVLENLKTAGGMISSANSNILSSAADQQQECADRGAQAAVSWQLKLRLLQDKLAAADAQHEEDELADDL
eukprot:gene11763-11908_t